MYMILISGFFSLLVIIATINYIIISVAGKEEDKAEDALERAVSIVVNRLGAGSRSDEDEACCPVCLDRARDTALLDCGHLLCKPCTTELPLEGGSKRCPLCRAVIKDFVQVVGLGTGVLGKKSGPSEV